jgi:hypothetical protein
LASLRHATISGCTDCHIIIGAVSGAVTITGCERCSITLAARSLTVASCSDTSLYVMCNTPPLCVGDSRDVTFAPHNTRYATIGAHLGLAQLSTDPSRNYWGTLRTLPPTAAAASVAATPADGDDEDKEGSKKKGEGGGDGDGGVRLLDPAAFTLRLAPFVLVAESAPDATTALPVRNIPTSLALPKPDCVRVHCVAMPVLRSVRCRQRTPPPSAPTALGSIACVPSPHPSRHQQQTTTTTTMSTVLLVRMALLAAAAAAPSRPRSYRR